MTEPAFLETGVWLWKLLWADNYNMRSTILHPSFHDTEDDVIQEIEGQIGGSVIKLISKAQLYERWNGEILCVP